MKFTIFGGRGFIGSALVRSLTARGHEVRVPARGDRGDFDLGHAIYCVGVTADFRTRTLDAGTAHVGWLCDLLRSARYDSFLYLSSTRVYRAGAQTDEHAPLTLRPLDPDDLYNATKLAGEALCLALPDANVRVARLSNVAGVDPQGTSFLASVLRDAAETGHVTLHTGLDSEKDYIALADVVGLLERITLSGSQRLYNVASGRNVRHAEIVAALEAAGCTMTIAPDAPIVYFPPIDTTRIREEFGARASNLAGLLPDLFAATRAALAAEAAAPGIV